MPTPESYKGLSEDELRERLALAEAACILSGWCAKDSTPGGDAATQAWMEWSHHVGVEYCRPSSHPDLDERRVHELTALRRDIRDQTLRRIHEGYPDLPDTTADG